MFNPTIARIGTVTRIVFLYLIILLCLPVLSHGQICSYRIMPLGDSITKGIGSSDLSSYRKDLFSLLNVSTGYEVDLVGSLSDGPSTFDNDHEGHSGYTAAQIALYTLSWLKTNPAEIVLLHAGTNRLTTSIQGVETILDEIDRFSTDTWVVLALIINQDPYNTTVLAYNNNLLAMAQNRIAAGDKILVVDQEGALIYPDDLADSLHPNDEGYFKMAQAWTGALEPLLDDLCSGAPQIISSAVAPKTRAFVDQAYQYQVRAYGDPGFYFELVSSPIGMSIDPDSGAITWVPSVTGSFNVTVRVRNSFGSDSQSFVIVVTDPASELVIDNGSSGTLSTGTWKVSVADSPYGVDSLYSKTVSGTYTFNAERSGAQEVYLWWTQYANRSTNVPVRIYDGLTLIATVSVDQTTNGGRWNLLGSYSFSGAARVVVVSTSSLLTTCADAVRFVPIAPTAVVIDNGGSGTLSTGTWKVSVADGAYGAASLYSKTVSGTYTFQAAVSGAQEVYLWWTQYENRSMSVPVRIYDGSTLIATVNVDQTTNGGRWNLLGRYSFSGVARVVVVSTSSSLTTCADAVRFVVP
jgi:hypothetical protein